MKRTSILVTGLARNVEKHILNELPRIASAFRDFERVEFLIVESDSSDGTVSSLHQLSKTVGNFRFVSLGKLEDSIPDRIFRISHCRDFYLQELRTNERYRAIDFLCIIDFDLINDKLNTDSINSCFDFSDWCGVFGNQSGAYYDVFALRASNWSDRNCWESDRILRSENIPSVISQQMAVYSKKRKLPTAAPWVEVDSAFGGIGIYKRPCIENGNYLSAAMNSPGECEHVTFNKSLKDGGHKLYINPKLLNFSWNDHNQSERILRRLRRQIRVMVYFWKTYF